MFIHTDHASQKDNTIKSSSKSKSFKVIMDVKSMWKDITKKLTLENKLQMSKI